MDRDSHHLKFILSLTRTYMRNNPYYTIIWLFMRYARLRFERLTSLQTRIQSVPDVILAKLIKKHHDERSKNYVDFECCALGKLDCHENDATPSWHYVCSKISGKKYKLLIVLYKHCQNSRIIVPETMRFNIANSLGHALDDRSYFVMPAPKGETCLIAAEARISMIINSHDCSNDLIDSLLKTYFRAPRYMRRKNIFSIDVKKYAPEYCYSSSSIGPSKIFFRVEYLGVRSNNKVNSTSKGCYVVKGETNLTQSSNIFAYVTPELGEVVEIEAESPVDLLIEMCSIGNCPPFLEKPLSSLVECLAPFLQKDIQMKIRPVFLVKGAPGSGKFKLIQCLAKRNGLNLLNVDFSEIQCLSAAQTEAKLRIVLQNARTRVPCILRLSNIQIFAKNSEGKKDERIVSTFGAELEKLNEQLTEYPVIVIATLENDELEADMERLFIETVCIEHPNQSERADALSWLLKSKGLGHQGNLTTIAGSISDFGLADLEALLMQTIKIAYQTRPMEKQTVNLTLTDNDFVQACELMESSFSDRVDAPRIPKVYWEDIGGLASLKHEIKRRIELPMLNKMGLGKSGLILYGPPGTGKTLLAKAVATECQLHFMSVKGPELLNMYVGQSEKNIREVFERARAAAPCVIFFDELDSLAPNRGRSGDSGGVMDRVVSQLLAEMDGLESSGNIFIIAATNRLDLIDPALLRPGRFDKMLYVGIYDDRDSQLSVLRAVTRRFRMKNDGDELNEIVDKLPKNLTGADLYAVCSDAWLFAVRRYIQTLDNSNDETTKTLFKTNCQYEIIVEFQDFAEAVRNLVPSLSIAELARYEKLGMEFSPNR